MEFSKFFELVWYEKLKHYVESSEFHDIAYKINQERKKYVILPPQGSELFLKVFRVTPYDSIKCVIYGQDPYHGDNQFDGLAFSNSTLDNPQPSLANILEEVENDIYDGFNLERINNFSLYSWAEQGVFLINVGHTVVKGKPGSHLHYWRNFSKEVIKALCDKDDLVHILLGRQSQQLKEYITNPTHKIIEASHPSPYSVNTPAPIAFANSKVFSKCNQYLKELNKQEIIW